MPIAERLALYRKLEAERKRPLIVYVTNERPGVPSQIAGDVLPEIMDQLERLPDVRSDANKRLLDLLVVSNGGDPTVAFRIITLLRERVDHITVLIPQAAYSAATLLALGADEILMHPNGNLGPVDPQIQVRTADGPSAEFSSVDVTAFLRFAKDEVGISDQKHLSALFQILCNQVGSVPLGFSTRALQLSVSLGEKLLLMHMNEANAEERARTLAESLCKDFFDHGYAVGRKEAKQLGLKVATGGSEVEKLIWSIWLDFESELQVRTRFSPMHVIMQSAEGPKLASPVPQVTVPAGTPAMIAQAAYEAAISTVTINPIDVEVVMAMVESTRLASRNVDSRKVIASRNAELKIEFNSISVWNGWKNTPLP